MSWSTQSPPPRAQNVLGGVSLENNGITITAVKGNLIDHRVDVIVNTTGTDLKLDNQGVSSAVLKAAGQGIQQECNNNAPNGIRHGEFVVTGGHNLNCNYVYHGALPSWGNSDSVKCLKKLVSSSLDKAASYSSSSIAFPAMGTGGLGYPRDKVANIIYEELDSFATQNSGTSLTDIRLVIFSKDTQTIQAFENEIQRLSQAAVGPAASGPSGSGYWVSKGPFTLQTQEGITVKSIKGNIVNAQVDVVVNSTTKSLDITSGGGVSAALANAAGAQNIQQECKKACSGGIDYGEICETSGGNLPCRYIYHSAVPDWSESGAEQYLEEMIENSLEKADGDGMSSIAFPAIGTGGQHYPHDKVATVIFKQIREFSENTSNPSLSEIHIVLYEKDHKCLKAFDAEIKNLTGTSASRPHILPNPVRQRPKRHAIPLPMAKVSPGKQWVKVEVVQGDITQERTQAIVNSTNENMSLDAEVSKAILRAAGKPFQDEVEKLAKAGSIGEIAVTTAGNLNCSHVIHVVIPRTDGSGTIDAQKWNRAVSMCLTRVEALGLSSVSFPALGTGNMGSDPSVMAEVLLHGIYTYLRTGAVRTLQQLRIVVYDKKNVPIYEKAHQLVKSRKSGHIPTKPNVHSLPAHWKPMPPTTPVESVQLNPNDSEYKVVANNFESSLSPDKRTIVRIERIQNPRTFRNYQNEKHYIGNVIGSGVRVERKLWHGTSIDAINDINATNFNRSYCGSANAHAYGQGVYFALSARYSDDPKYARPDSNGLKYMYQSLVITGNSVKGHSQMKVPPKNPANPNFQYDSAVDNPKTPSIFVVFYDSKAYPEYLITYKN